VSLLLLLLLLPSPGAAKRLESFSTEACDTWLAATGSRRYMPCRTSVWMHRTYSRSPACTHQAGKHVSYCFFAA
jgi:hypothetical protein